MQNHHRCPLSKQPPRRHPRVPMPPQRQRTSPRHPNPLPRKPSLHHPRPSPPNPQLLLFLNQQSSTHSPLLHKIRCQQLIHLHHPVYQRLNRLHPQGYHSLRSRLYHRFLKRLTFPFLVGHGNQAANRYLVEVHVVEQTSIGDVAAAIKDVQVSTRRLTIFSPAQNGLEGTQKLATEQRGHEAVVLLHRTIANSDSIHTHRLCH
ncbi:hypothetical protein F5B22DRAFT_85205 [Xylaria bambusicola]|uniref:uncharacterized protein n=1 Tax=Xylaria bambusicola TaxID=326684 RepID=UPI0020080346|nr:uncharacterized protein F5B22DRAFT_85205 [Xylaria bambusicola]KAI0517948.1 hypothetical protein F5B22DRAFT_85205 [Xylaria bambusicola]